MDWTTADEDPWHSPLFNKLMYKWVGDLNPCLLREVCCENGLLPLSSMVETLHSTHDPHRHNHLIINYIRPNGRKSFETFLKVISDMGYDAKSKEFREKILKKKPCPVDAVQPFSHGNLIVPRQGITSRDFPTNVMALQRKIAYKKVHRIFLVEDVSLSIDTDYFQDHISELRSMVEFLQHSEWNITAMAIQDQRPMTFTFSKGHCIDVSPAYTLRLAVKCGTVPTAEMRANVGTVMATILYYIAMGLGWENFTIA